MVSGRGCNGDRRRAGGWAGASREELDMAGPAAPHCDVAGDSCDVTAVCSITVNTEQIVFIVLASAR